MVSSLSLGMVPEDDALKDVGPVICEHIRLAMQTVEPEWHVKLPRGYDWWPHWFKQRVSANNGKESFGSVVSKIIIESALLEEVPETDAMYKQLSEINIDAILNSFIFIAEDNQVISCSSIMSHEQNERVASHLGSISVANQASESGSIAIAMQEVFGGKLATSAPPGSTVRSLPDEMVNIEEIAWIPGGRYPSVYVGDECPRVERELGGWSLLTTASENGLTAEFPYKEGAESVLLKIMSGEKDFIVETVCLRVEADYQHPRLGNGMRVILALPVPVGDKEGPEIANKLNLAERVDEELYAHQVGSWSYQQGERMAEWFLPFYNGSIRKPDGPGALVHITFLPNSIYFKGITSVMFQSAALRSKWAKVWVETNTDLRCK